MQGKAWRTSHLTISRARFHLPDVQVLWSWHHRLRIWALLSVIKGLAIAGLPWMLDLWSSRRTVFAETGSSTWIFSSAVLSPVLQYLCGFSKQSSLYDDLFLSVLIFAYCSFLQMLSSHDSWQISHCPILSHRLSLSTNSLTRALQSINKRKKNIQYCQLKFLQSNPNKQIVFLNFLVCPLFCPSLVYKPSTPQFSSIYLW
jgi:hypothetical protein